MSFVGRLFGFGRDDHYDRGIRAYDQGNYTEAIDEFKHCLENSNDPSTVRLAKFYTAESYAQIGSNSLKSASPLEAIQSLSAALELHPTYPDLHLQLALAYRACGDREHQVAHVNRALELNPTYSGAMMLQGILWYEDQRYDEALQRIEQAANLDSGLHNERYGQALAAHHEGDFESALRHLNAMRNTDALQAEGPGRAGGRAARAAPPPRAPLLRPRRPRADRKSVV